MISSNVQPKINCDPLFSDVSLNIAWNLRLFREMLSNSVHATHNDFVVTKSTIIEQARLSSRKAMAHVKKTFLFRMDHFLFGFVKLSEII